MIMLGIGIITTTCFWLFIYKIIVQNKTDHNTWVSISMRAGSDLFTVRMLIRLQRLYNRLYDIRNVLPFLGDVESRKMYRISQIIDKANESLKLKIK